MVLVFWFGRGDKNRTHIYGFGDRYTNRCTTPLTVNRFVFFRTRSRPLGPSLYGPQKYYTNYIMVLAKK